MSPNTHVYYLHRLKVLEKCIDTATICSSAAGRLHRIVWNEMYCDTKPEDDSNGMYCTPTVLCVANSVLGTGTPSCT